METAGAIAGRGGAKAWYALAVLVTLYLVSLLDRSIISMLIGGIKTDLQIGDFEASLLMGTAFGVAYVLFGLPFGWLADRLPRPLVIFLGICLWSLACAGGGLATTFAMLFVSRSLVGAGEAALSPCAYSLISELFPRERIALPMAIYHYGGSAGGAVALLVGGLIAQAATSWSGVALPIVGALQPWQLALIAVGAPGLLIALLAFTLPEPRRDRPLPPASLATDGAVGAFVGRNRLLLTCHFLAFAVSLVVVYACSFWNPEHLARAFGWPHGKIGMVLASAALMGPLVGQVSAVALIRWFDRRGAKDATFKAYLCHVVVALPFSCLGYLTGSPVLCLASIFMLFATLSPLMTFGSSALQLYVPERMRGRLSGAFLSFVSLAGLGAGPAFVGYVVQFQFRDEARLGAALALVNGVSLSIVILCLLVAAPRLRRAVAEAEGAPHGQALATLPPSHAEPSPAKG